MRQIRVLAEIPKSAPVHFDSPGAESCFRFRATTESWCPCCHPQSATLPCACRGTKETIGHDTVTGLLDASIVTRETQDETRIDILVEEGHLVIMTRGDRQGEKMIGANTRDHRAMITPDPGKIEAVRGKAVVAISIEALQEMALVA